MRQEGVSSYMIGDRRPAGGVMVYHMRARATAAAPDRTIWAATKKPAGGRRRWSAQSRGTPKHHTKTNIVTTLSKIDGSSDTYVQQTWGREEGAR